MQTHTGSASVGSRMGVDSFKRETEPQGQTQQSGHTVRHHWGRQWGGWPSPGRWRAGGRGADRELCRFPQGRKEAGDLGEGLYGLFLMLQNLGVFMGREAP